MDKLRNFLQSWPGKLIMIGTLVPMAFLGVQGTMGGSGVSANELIKVGDQVVTVDTYNQNVEAFRKQLLDRNIPASLISDEALAADVLRNLTTRTLLENQVAQLGMAVSDETLSKLLQQDSSFHNAEGKFSNELFAQYLQSQGLNKERLFQNFRAQVGLRQLNAGILTTAIYPNDQISHLLDLNLEARELWVHRFSWKDYIDQVNISDEQIAAYFNANKDKLIKPASVDLTYVELNPLLVKIDPANEDEIKAQYEVYLKEKGINGRVLAQILLTGDDAETKANDVYAKLQKGESFESLAKTHSDDPSGANGGEIGTFNPSVFGGDAVAVENALFGVAVGGYTKPVKTKFGYQIFKITKMNADVPSIESLRDELIDAVAQYKRKTVYAELSSKINNLASDSVGAADIAKEFGLELQEIKSYPKTNNTTALAQPAVIAAAFDDLLIQDQNLSHSIDLGDKTVWVQPKNYQESRPLTLEEAKEEIKVTLAKKKAIELAMTAANEAVIDANANGTAKLTVPSAAFGVVTRNNDKLNISEVASLFIHQAKEGQDVWVVESDEGASVLVGGPVAKQSEAQLSEVDRVRAMQLILSNIGEDQLNDYVQYLHDTNEVTINEDALAKR